ncbi:hypothetical protein BDZ97DRAFT_1761762 [Flammula alnicola]|nr:hypothetical protein BDZ97DRAFT_1761762 [Flammula alnicola]
MSSTPPREDSLPPSSSPGDPMRSVIDLVNARAASSGLVRSRSEYEGDDDDESNIDPSLRRPRSTNTELTVATATNFLMRGHAIKRQKTFTPESDRDFEEFLRSNNDAEHKIYIYSGLLECRDLLKLLTQSSEYRMSETLKKTAADYATAFVLAPSILFYKKKSGPPTVLAAMRELNISGLPASCETGRCDVVLTAIAKGMTDIRYHVKDKIANTVKKCENGVSRDIATLTQACIGNSKAKLTAALLIRIAFLRWVMAKYPKLSSEKYWDQVDTSLADYRQQFPGSGEMQIAFRVIYDEDLKKYGAPDTTNNPTTASHEVDSWLRTINVHAGALAPTAAGPVEE